MERLGQGLSILTLVCVGFLTRSPAAAVNRAEAEEVAQLLATLLDAGRIVIDRNQRLIDDQHRGDKGFTPPVFEKQLIDEFHTRTGIDLKHLNTAHVPPIARDLLRALVEASKSVVADAQVVINQRGVGYKNFIPATFGSQPAARFSAKSHVRMKQTALQPRNEKNQPDHYEETVLRRLAARADPSGPDSEVTDSGNTLRMMAPIYLL